jgi:hypothetical protein
MLTDATGNEFLAYGTERTDERPGMVKEFTRSVHGKITNGVLTTDPIDVYIPQTFAYDTFDAILIRGARLKLKVLPDQANGLLAGYVDIESFYRTQNGCLNANSIAYGRQSSISIYKELYKLADAYPDPATGRNTAISAAKELTFRQVFIKHSNQPVTSRDGAVKDKKAIASVQKPAQ